jgi:hypothetical protein
MPENSPIMQEAYDDLLRRSLSKVPGDLARLIYLASTREYNTGRYHHEGLAVRYRADAAEQALREAHRRVFQKVASCSLEELVQELQTYVNASSQSREELLRAWQKLEPFRVALPMDVSPVAARFFVSNVRLALAILRHREAQQAHP